MGWLLGAAAVVVLTWGLVSYNRLVGLRQRAAGAWSDIDAQLKRRHDLIPALVETVKGYVAHERGTLESVVERRSAAVRMQGRPPGDPEVSRGESLLVGALRGMFALAEQYPELRASQRFGQLQQDLTEVEDQIQHARRYYNAVVRDFNTRVARFPDLLLARAFRLLPRPFFELDSPLERRAAQVDLGD